MMASILNKQTKKSRRSQLVTIQAPLPSERRRMCKRREGSFWARATRAATGGLTRPGLPVHTLAQPPVR